MGLGGHLSRQDKELIEDGVHPIIDTEYRVRSTKRKFRKKGWKFVRKELDGYTYIQAEHPKGGKFSVCEMLPSFYKEEITTAIIDFLNKGT